MIKGKVVALNASLDVARICRLHFTSFSLNTSSGICWERDSQCPWGRWLLCSASPRLWPSRVLRQRLIPS